MFKGSYVAIVTPFNNDLSINYKKYKELLEWHVKNKTDGIVVCGTTGETPTLSESEQFAIIDYTVKIIDGRIPVIAGTGSNNTMNALHLSKKAEKLGVNGLLIANPHYNKGNNEGIFQHYKLISDNVNIPIILYNVPSRTGCNLTVDLVKRLSTLKNIIGVKEASGDLEQIKQIINGTSDDFIVLSGNDNQMVDVVKLGGYGVISVSANIMPYENYQICKYALKGDFDKANSIFDKYSKLIITLSIEVNPIPVKEALNLQGFNVGSFRLPLYKMEESNLKVLKKELQILK